MATCCTRKHWASPKTSARNPLVLSMRPHKTSIPDMTPPLSVTPQDKKSSTDIYREFYLIHLITKSVLSCGCSLVSIHMEHNYVHTVHSEKSSTYLSSRLSYYQCCQCFPFICLTTLSVNPFYDYLCLCKMHSRAHTFTLCLVFFEVTMRRCIIPQAATFK